MSDYACHRDEHDEDEYEGYHHVDFAYTGSIKTNTIPGDTITYSSRNDGMTIVDYSHPEDQMLPKDTYVAVVKAELIDPHDSFGPNVDRVFSLPKVPLLDSEKKNGLDHPAVVVSAKSDNAKLPAFTTLLPKRYFSDEQMETLDKYGDVMHPGTTATTPYKDRALLPLGSILHEEYERHQSYGDPYSDSKFKVHLTERDGSSKPYTASYLEEAQIGNDPYVVGSADFIEAIRNDTMNHVNSVLAPAQLFHDDFELAIKLQGEKTFNSRLHKYERAQVKFADFRRPGAYASSAGKRPNKYAASAGVDDGPKAKVGGTLRVYYYVPPRSFPSE